MPLAEQTLVEQQIDLLNQIHTLTSQHPAGPFVVLMMSPLALPLECDELLVQVPDPERREMRLVPRKIAEITLNDILHDLHTVNPQDRAPIEYAQNQDGAGYSMVKGMHWMKNQVSPSS